MTGIQAIDVGFVSADGALVDFYEEALEAERLEERVFPMATVHRLAIGPATLKVMVPTDRPAPAAATEQFWEVAGLRYVTLWVEDLDALVARWNTAGGSVALGPLELRPGVRTAVLRDPDGNAVEVMQEG